MNITDKTKLIDSLLSRVSVGSPLREKLPFGCGSTLHTWLVENKKRDSTWTITSNTLNRIDAFLKWVSSDDAPASVHDDYESLLNIMMGDARLFIFLRGDYNPWVFESHGIFNPEQEAALCLQQ